MKRLLGLLVVISMLVGLPLSHLVFAKGQVERRGGKTRVEICHIDDEASAIVGGPAGHIITVAEPAVPAHLAHGDCEEWGTDEATGFCLCSGGGGE